MSIDDRDYMRDRHGASDTEARRFRTSEQQKARQAEALKSRFAGYNRASRGLAVPKARRSRFFLIALVLVIGAMFWTRWPDIPARFLPRFASNPFPETGAVRWFTPVAVNGVGDAAPLTITGLAEAGQHVVVKLDTWEAHAPIAMIPIRSGETATLQVPLGRYRISYAPNASWQGEFKLQGGAREGVEPLEFYREGNRLMGHRIDLGGRINGNLKIRRSSFF
jgi:hypothetical protein